MLLEKNGGSETLVSHVPQGDAERGTGFLELYRWHWARELVFSQKDCEKTQFRLKIHTKFIKLCQTLSLLAEDNGTRKFVIKSLCLNQILSQISS